MQFYNGFMIGMIAITMKLVLRRILLDLQVALTAFGVAVVGTATLFTSGSAYRSYNGPNGRENTMGFRLVKTAK